MSAVTKGQSHYDFLLCIYPKGGKNYKADIVSRRVRNHDSELEDAILIIFNLVYEDSVLQSLETIGSPVKKYHKLSLHGFINKDCTGVSRTSLQASVREWRQNRT